MARRLLSSFDFARIEDHVYSEHPKEALGVHEDNPASIFRACLVALVAYLQASTVEQMEFNIERLQSQRAKIEEFMREQSGGEPPE
jgi:hypothetical protein